MQKLKTLFSASLIASSLLAALPAAAYDAGDIIVRVGAATVAPNDDSDKVDVAGLALLDGVELNSDTQLGITGTYMINQNWGVELLAATPFQHDLKVEGVGIDAGSSKHLPPTLSFQYYPRGGQNGVQPYVGVGINYTVFFDEGIDGQLEGALGAITQPVTGSTAPVKADLELDSSWGLAMQAGFDYPINESLSLNVAVWYIDIDTKAKISTAVADVRFDVEIDPWVYMVGLAYKF